jgi:hypothetical protein
MTSGRAKQSVHCHSYSRISEVSPMTRCETWPTPDERCEWRRLTSRQGDVSHLVRWATSHICRRGRRLTPSPTNTFCFIGYDKIINTKRRYSSTSPTPKLTRLTTYEPFKNGRLLLPQECERLQSVRPLSRRGLDQVGPERLMARCGVS